MLLRENKGPLYPYIIAMPVGFAAKNLFVLSKASLCAMPRLLLTKSPGTDETSCAMVFSFKDYMIVCAKLALYQ